MIFNVFDHLIRKLDCNASAVGWDYIHLNNNDGERLETMVVLDGSIMTCVFHKSPTSGLVCSLENSNGSRVLTLDLGSTQKKEYLDKFDRVKNAVITGSVYGK